MESSWDWHKEAETCSLWRFHEDGNVTMYEDEGKFYVLVREDVSNDPQDPEATFEFRCTVREEFRTKEAADMFFADAVHGLYQQLAPTVSSDYLRQLLDGKSLYGSMDDDEDGCFHGTLEYGPRECECSCEECDRFNPEHDACRQSTRCGHSWMLHPEDAQRAIEIHGNDTDAVLQYLQRLVYSEVDEELDRDKDSIRQGIPTSLPVQITDPDERARIWQAERE